jgi:serine/threonine-protein kinase HipA
MTRTLDVFLFADFVGRLVQDDGGQMVFDYADGWLTSGRAAPLSQSLPLRAKRFRNKECRGYFAGVLPEESKREIIARNLGISARNDYAMLERIGGECAGAVTFMPAGQPLPAREPGYRKLSQEELVAIIRELPLRPLLAGEKGVRLSLAGAQDKVAIRVDGREICLPLGNAASTHILKPAVERFEGLVHNESFCMKLATAAGLPTAPVEIGSVEGLEYLLVERDDRYHRIGPDGAQLVERLHQEDFCQALGIVSEHKYQKEGGPTLKQCFGLVRSVSSAPVLDLRHLLDAVIFNWLVGNNDAHGKNFSLLYTGIGTGRVETRLAPLYDIVSTVAYPELSGEMAMRIGDQYSSEGVTPKDFEKLAEDAELGKPLVKRRVSELAEILLERLPLIDARNPAAEKVASILRRRAEAARMGFAR